jgi:hypothetical protein
MPADSVAVVMPSHRQHHDGQDAERHHRRDEQLQQLEGLRASSNQANTSVWAPTSQK